MKKLHVVCTVALLALAAMVLIGCDQPTSNPGDNPSNPSNPGNNPSDSWTKVETVDGLEGVWKSSVIATGSSPMTTEMMLTYLTKEEVVGFSMKTSGSPEIPLGSFSKEDFKQVLKDGKVPVFMMECGYMYINASKTKLKIEGTVKKDDVDESTWKNLQGMVSAEFEGDVVLKNDTPTQITIIQYYNKQ